MEILIILVVYEKKIENIELVNKFREKKIDIFIYDNSTMEQEYPNGIYYIHDQSNSGVSKGYNCGIELAKRLKKQYVLLLDQDTKFTFEMIEKYEILVKKYRYDYIYVSIIGRENKIYSPFMEKNFGGKPYNIDKFKYKEIYCLKNNSLINSSMLIPLRIIDTIGMFNEKIKLDFSDMYFIDKYKKYKNEIILIDNFIEHSLSGDEERDKEKELNRFKFYCNGAKEICNNYVRLITFHRMIRLILKYKSLTPFLIYLDYFWRDKKI